MSADGTMQKRGGPKAAPLLQNRRSLLLLLLLLLLLASATSSRSSARPCCRWRPPGSSRSSSAFGHDVVLLGLLLLLLLRCSGGLATLRQLHLLNRHLEIGDGLGALERPKVNRDVEHLAEAADIAALQRSVQRQRRTSAALAVEQDRGQTSGLGAVERRHDSRDAGYGTLQRGASQGTDLRRPTVAIAFAVVPPANAGVGSHWGRPAVLNTKSVGKYTFVFVAYLSGTDGGVFV